jgi:hypothetical protein
MAPIAITTTYQPPVTPVLQSRSVPPAMAARIVSFVQDLAAPDPAALGVAEPAYPAAAAGSHLPAPCQHVWRGASGRLYAHRVYGLIGCPPLPPAGYILVRRDAEGRRTPLRIGLGTSDAPTLNLAEIRRLGAQAGANEVHVLLDPSPAGRRLIACDLRAALLGTLAATAEPAPAI